MFNTINKNILTILGIDSLPKEDQLKIVGEIAPLIYQESIARALDLMDEKDEEEFEKLVDENPDPEAMITYLAQKVPTLEQIVNEEAQKAKNAAPIDDAIEEQNTL